MRHSRAAAKKYRFGSRKILFGSLLILSFICTMLPASAAIRSNIFLWPTVVGLLFVFRASCNACIVSLSILINRSIDPKLLGTANGVATTCQTMCQLIAPLVIGRLYSWSLTNIQGVSDGALGFPFNQFLCYYDGWY